MKKPAPSALAAAALLGLWIYPARAEVLDPVITVGTHYLWPDTVTTIPILVSTSDQNPVLVRSLYFYVQAGDGGPVNQGIDTMPKITAVDVIGPDTLFYQPTGTQNTWHLPASGGNYLIWHANTTVSTTERPRAAQGKLALVTIDTTGMSWHDTRTLTIQNVAQSYSPPGYTTSFGVTPAKLVDGQIIILPEPATLTMLSAAVVIALLLRRRMRRIR